MSTILVNTLTGTSTAGSIAVTGEGNSTTTNLQQGLVKAWNKGDSDATRLDSFNLSSNTDNGTGDFTYTLTNAMGNANYSIVASAQYANTSAPDYPEQTTTAYNVQVFTRHDSLTADNSKHTQIIAGDLA